MEDEDFFETRVGRLIVRYKRVNGNPQLWRVYLDINSNFDPSKVKYETEFARAKEAAKEYFRRRQKQKAR